MRPPGSGGGGGTVMFADQQQQLLLHQQRPLHHQQQQQHQQHSRQHQTNNIPQQSYTLPASHHQNGHHGSSSSGGGRRVQIVDTLVDYPIGVSMSGHHVNGNHHQRSEPPPSNYHPHHNPMEQQQQHPVGSPPPVLQHCQCCPFGYHIDLGFVKFAEDVASGKEQIQNWSSPAIKRARRLMASPCSDRTLMDTSVSSTDAANVSSSYPNDSSLMSKSIEVDELPELIDQPHHQHTIAAQYHSNGRPRAPSVPIYHQQQQHHHPQGILKNATEWHQHGHSMTPPTSNFPPRTAPIPISSSRGRTAVAENYQHSGSPYLQHHHQHPAQHQSRYYEAHVQQQKQKQRQQQLPAAAAYEREHHPSPPTYIVGSPLRTSTPRTNDEVHNILSQPKRPLFIHTTTTTTNGYNTKLGRDPEIITSAPSSPIPPNRQPPYQQTAIAQSLAQLKKTPQKATATATYFTTPQTAHTSLSALSSATRNAFTNPPITTSTPRRHVEYLGNGGSNGANRRRMLSPETTLPSFTPMMADGGGALRSSNLQSRAFFHQQNNNNNSAPSTANRVPYRSRASGSVPQIGPNGGFASLSTLELGEFASVRRRRLNGDIGGSATLQSAHLVRSLSPPLHLPLSTYASSSPHSSSAGSSSLPRHLAIAQQQNQPQQQQYQQNHQQQFASVSLANLEAQLQPSEQFYDYDEGTLKPAKKSKKKEKRNGATKNAGAIEREYQIPVKSVQATVLCSSGTQTPLVPSGKEIGTGTEDVVVIQQQQIQSKPPPPLPPFPLMPSPPKAAHKKEFKDIGTSPEPLATQTAPTEELPFTGLISFASVGVDTRDLPTPTKLPEENAAKKSPPAPPPKPSGPDVEAELLRRRQAELMGSLVAEFQFCLGHEPEHLPNEQLESFQKRKSLQEEQLKPETTDRGADAFPPIVPSQNSLATSTTDLAPTKAAKSVVDIGVGAIWPVLKVAEKAVSTVPEVPKKQGPAVGVQTEETLRKEAQVETEPDGLKENLQIHSEKVDAEVQTDAAWMETEIGRRLAEAEALRKEKRKRLSVERSTETDEEEAPDQFIMITCNKCEQRSSVASDELFEKIVAPADEGTMEENMQFEQSSQLVDQQQQQSLQQQHQHDVSPPSLIVLETVKEEPEFLASSREEVKIPDISAESREMIIAIQEEEEMKEEEKKEEEILLLTRTKEFKSVEMHKFVAEIPVGMMIVEKAHQPLKEAPREEPKVMMKEERGKILVEEQWRRPKEEWRREEPKEELDEEKMEKHWEKLKNEWWDEKREFWGEPGKEEERLLEELKEEHLEEVKEKEVWEKSIEGAREEPKLVKREEERRRDEDEEEQQLHQRSQQAMAEPIEPTTLAPVPIAAPVVAAPILTAQMDQLLQAATTTTTKQPSEELQNIVMQSSSPLSSDEGLVLAEEDEDLLELDMEGDRISIETDVQTVIYIEPSLGQRSISSASSSTTKTPTSTEHSSSTPISGGDSSSSARTEALRKLLTEPPRQSNTNFFQRDADANRSYRSDKTKAQQIDMEYIADRHRSTEAQLQQSEPSTPSGDDGTHTRKALKETISLKKSISGPVSFSSSAPGTSSSNASFPPDPIPARIPRPKIARFAPGMTLAETPDEEEEAADRLTPLRSEMRSMSTWSTGSNSPSSSPRMSQKALIFRTQIGGPLEEEDEDDDEFERPSSRERQQQQQHEAMEDASSTSSEGARTYEMSEDENADYFELSTPLRDALETINDCLVQGSKTPTSKAESEQQQKQIEWAHKYAQHEWLKLSTKKSANAGMVEQFLDALEAYDESTLMEVIVNMTDQNGNTALHYAVSNENFDVISVLLDSKVCRIDQMNKAGYSALMLGALCELRNETECAIMQRLFQMGNVNAKAVKHSQTALMLAASHGRLEATNLLLKCGADVNIQDVDGSSALMCAAEHGQKEIVKILLKQPNIDASLTDCDNQTALSIAVENQHRDIGVLIYAHLNFNRLADTSGENSVTI